ncbi:MAG: sigma-54-dependent Fis family transcriptional regulator [Isosphaeraceae bacterium]|jgi:two-component system response regulator HydG|nr:MAG: sigma-54-dependent Fis family transcriptional regulator [Isosphaeraceae bacterium]
MPHRLLIVHPDPSARSLIYSMLQNLGHRIEEADTPAAALRYIESQPAQLALIGVADEVGPALDLIDQIRRRSPSTRTLLLCETPRPDWNRELAMRGAAGCLRFPMPANQLRAAVAQALPETPSSWPRNSGSPQLTPVPLRPIEADGSARAVHGTQSSLATVCEDSTFRQILDLAEALALKRSPFLISGERGSGRRFLARTLHAKSPWRDGPFLVVSCSADNANGQETLQEVETLLGRVNPEDPTQDEPGLLARASGGTLFLDNLQDLAPALQTQLLRVLRDGDYCPVQSPRVYPLDCRLILGSSEELADLVEQGQFRSDLFYALSAVTLKIPPLRHRVGDILKLAEHFRERFAREAGKPIVGISAEAARRLTGHDWPNNISELKSVIQRAVARCRGHWIEPNHLDLDPRPAGTTARRSGSSLDPGRQAIRPLKESLEEPERKLILEALRALNWNRQETARVLDINRTTLYKKMKKYGLVFEEAIWTN